MQLLGRTHNKITIGSRAIYCCCLAYKHLVQMISGVFLIKENFMPNYCPVSEDNLEYMGAKRYETSGLCSNFVYGLYPGWVPEQLVLEEIPKHVLWTLQRGRVRYEPRNIFS